MMLSTTRTCPRLLPLLDRSRPFPADHHIRSNVGSWREFPLPDGEGGTLTLTGRLRIFPIVRQLPRKAPIFFFDFLDDDMDIFGTFAEYTD
jgi:hypothetical protein